MDTPKKFFGTIDQVFRWGLNLAGARPPARTAKRSKPRCPPGGALLLEPPPRQDGWWNQTFSIQISITLGGLEARAVTKSETDAHARRFLELARAIADQEASRALKAYAAELLEKADAIERKDED